MNNNEFKNFRIEALDRIERPDPNIAVEHVREQFKHIVEEYCVYIPDHVDHYWYRLTSEDYTLDEFTCDVQRHTQRYLYNYFGGKIKTALRNELLELVAEYMMKIRDSVPELTKTYSCDVNESIKHLLDYESVMFHFEDVEVEQCKKIPIYELEKDKKIRNDYIKTLRRELQSNDKRMGLFDRQCIYEPALAYYSQFENWADRLYNSIRTILIKDLVKQADRWSTGGQQCQEGDS